MATTKIENEADRFVGVTVTEAESLNPSKYGNPCWRLHTDRGTFRTEPDAAVGYGVHNFRSPGAGADWFIGKPGVVVDIILNKANRVIAFERDGQVLR